MTDGTRIIRTVAIILVPALAFLCFAPRKMHVAPAAAAAPPADTALHIRSESPDALPSTAVVYPAGLDAARIKYLIEIDQKFAEPEILRVPKPGGAVLDATAADALAGAGWFEKSPAGGYTPTREAALHIPQLVEEPLAWRVPVATRKFMQVQTLRESGDGVATVGFTWQWDPNEAGKAIKSSFDLHQGTAEFVGGGEHPWDLRSVMVDGEWR